MFVVPARNTSSKWNSFNAFSFALLKKKIKENTINCHLMCCLISTYQRRNNILFSYPSMTQFDHVCVAYSSQFPLHPNTNESHVETTNRCIQLNCTIKWYGYVCPALISTIQSNNNDLSAAWRIKHVQNHRVYSDQWQ